MIGVVVDGLVRRADPLSSDNFVGDSVTALAEDRVLLRADRNGLRVYYRRELTKSLKNFLFVGVGAAGRAR